MAKIKSWLYTCKDMLTAGMTMGSQKVKRFLRSERKISGGVPQLSWQTHAFEAIPEINFEKFRTVAQYLLPTCRVPENLCSCLKQS